MNGYERAKIIADIFQSVFIGIGALMGGLGALKVLGDWRERRRKTRDKKKWLKRFPKEKLGQDFRLLRISYSKDSEGSSVMVLGSSNNVYVCDKRTGTRHWIVDQETLTALGFNQEEVEGVKTAELKEYKIDKEVNLSE